MTTPHHGAVFAISLPLVLLLTVSPGAAHAGTPIPAGATQQDEAMTCDMIAAERSAIHDAVGKKTKAARVKKGLFGFARTVATVMVPGAALLGGGSALGSLAAQGAGQSAVQALSDTATKPVTAAQPSAEQAVRLARLDEIAAARQCVA